MAKGNDRKPFSESSAPIPFSETINVNEEVGVVRLFHVNAQSVKNKVSELEAFLSDKNVTILCLSEH